MKKYKTKLLMSALCFMALTQAISAAKIQYTLKLNDVTPTEASTLGLELTFAGNHTYPITGEEGREHEFDIPSIDYRGLVSIHSKENTAIQSRLCIDAYNDRIEWLNFSEGGTMMLALEATKEHGTIHLSCKELKLIIGERKKGG